MSKNKTPLDEFAKLLENPSHNLSVEVYTEDKDGRKPVNKSKNRITLADLLKRIDNLGNDLRNEMNAGFKQVNARLDYIVKANGLKDLSKSK